MVAEYKVTIKTPLMDIYGSDVEKKVWATGSYFDSYSQSEVTACDKNGTEYQENVENYGHSYVRSSFELRCESRAEINTQYQYVQGGKDETGRPQEESLSLIHI